MKSLPILTLNFSPGAERGQPTHMPTRCQAGDCPEETWGAGFIARSSETGSPCVRAWLHPLAAQGLKSVQAASRVHPRPSKRLPELGLHTPTSPDFSSSLLSSPKGKRVHQSLFI